MKEKTSCDFDVDVFIFHWKRLTFDVEWAFYTSTVDSYTFSFLLYLLNLTVVSMHIYNFIHAVVLLLK